MKKVGLLRWLVCLVVAAIVSFSTQAETSAQTFTDVGPNHQFQDIIEDMQKRGFISGYPDGTFKPGNKISRRHVAQLLSNSLPLKPKTNTTLRYKDVPTTHLNYAAIMKATQAGIFSGDLDGKFNPEASITRKQMAKVLDIAFDLDITSITYFPDVRRDWGYPHIQALAANNITHGNNGKFIPNGHVTRAHYAAFLHRALNMPQSSKPDPNASLTKGQMINLIHRQPQLIESTLVTHKSKGAPFSKVRVELLKNATQPLTDNLLKGYYADMCVDCDASLFFGLEVELDYRFEILENSPTRAKVKTVSFDQILGSANYLTYTFEKQDGKWKLANYEWAYLGAGSFNLTIEEGLQIVKKYYAAHHDPNTRVTYVKSTHENVFDWAVEREYRRLVYHLRVETRSGTTIVKFYPHSGLYDQGY